MSLKWYDKNICTYYYCAILKGFTIFGHQQILI
jgi:hypothetical protein